MKPVWRNSSLINENIHDLLILMSMESWVKFCSFSKTILKLQSVAAEDGDLF